MPNRNTNVDSMIVRLKRNYQNFEFSAEYEPLHTQVGNKYPVSKEYIDV